MSASPETAPRQRYFAHPKVDFSNNIVSVVVVFRKHEDNTNLNSEPFYRLLLRVLLVDVVDFRAQLAN